MKDFTKSVIEAMWSGTLCSVFVAVIWAMNPGFGWLIGLLFFIAGLIAAYKIYERNETFSSVFGVVTTFFAIVVALASFETLKKILVVAFVLDALSPMMPKLPSWLGKKSK